MVTMLALSTAVLVASPTPFGSVLAPKDVATFDSTTWTMQFVSPVTSCGDKPSPHAPQQHPPPTASADSRQGKEAQVKDKARKVKTLGKLGQTPKKPSKDTPLAKTIPVGRVDPWNEGHFPCKDGPDNGARFSAHEQAKGKTKRGPIGARTSAHDKEAPPKGKGKRGKGTKPTDFDDQWPLEEDERQMDLDGEGFVETTEPDSTMALKALCFVEETYGTNHPLSKSAFMELTRIQTLEAKLPDVPTHISMGTVARRLANLERKLSLQVDLMEQAKVELAAAESKISPLLPPRSKQRSKPSSKKGTTYSRMSYQWREESTRPQSRGSQPSTLSSREPTALLNQPSWLSFVKTLPKLLNESVQPLHRTHRPSPKDSGRTVRSQPFPTIWGLHTPTDHEKELPLLGIMPKRSLPRNSPAPPSNYSCQSIG
jgi:hypothetical protein